jgi:hypothetical protein
MSFNSFSQEGETVIINEDFNNLDKWEAYEFPKIKEHSTYTIIENGILKTQSNASASAIIYKDEFNVYEYPKINWRWKVDNILQKGDAKSKIGDDYPLRIYVAFKYDPKEAGIGKRLKYKSAKLLYGTFPPDSSLNYIWANKIHEEDIIPNSFTSKAQMILLKKGDKNVGKWETEEVDILEDYKKAFGEEPPKIASLIIMNDTDNTGESATSYVDYIKIFKKEK